jgi:hypothetical protein
MPSSSKKTAKPIAKDHLERGRRLRAFADETTTAHLRVKLLEAEYERLAVGRPRLWDDLG